MHTNNRKHNITYNILMKLKLKIVLKSLAFLGIKSSILANIRVSLNLGGVELRLLSKIKWLN